MHTTIYMVGPSLTNHFLRLRWETDIWSRNFVNNDDMRININSLLGRLIKIELSLNGCLA